MRRLGPLVVDAVRLAARAGGREVRVLVATQVLTGLLAGVQLLVAREALQQVLGHGGTVHVARALPAFALLAVVTGIASGGSAIQAQRLQLVGELVTRVTWQRILDVTTSVSLESFERPDFFDRLQRVQGNALTQPTVVIQGLLGIVGGLVGSVGLVVALLAVQPILVPILLLAGIPLFYLQRRGGRIEFAFALEQTPNLRRRFLLIDTLTSRPAAKEVRAFGVAPFLRARHDGLYDDYLFALRRKSRRRLRIQLLSTAITAAIGVAAIAVLLLLVSRGHVSLAAAGAAAAGIGLLGSKLEQLSQGAGSVLQAGLFLDDLATFLDLADSTPAEAPRQGEEVVPFEQLEVVGVSYTYPSSSTPVLHDIDLTLPRGKILALVGENGSGKTTLAKILASLLMPTTGEVRWDGQAVVEGDLPARREATAVLFQDFLHYELSLYDNVALGRPSRHSDAEAVTAAVSEAGAGGVLAGLPGGWETLLSPRFAGGFDLSGGQWQRVALARALFRDAPFVILDEPTAALDARAEAALFETIRTLLAGRTVVLISHRFSSVRHADEIAVLDHGRIVERGSHEALLRQQGTYAELFTLQAEAYGVTSDPDAVKAK